MKKLTYGFNNNMAVTDDTADTADTDAFGNRVITTMELTDYEANGLRPDLAGRVHAVVEVDSKAADRFVAARFYDPATGEWLRGYYFDNAEDAADKLRGMRQECRCPLKVMAHADNCACDFGDCAFYFEECDTDGEVVATPANGCTFYAQAQYQHQACEILQLIAENCGGY